MFVKRTLPLAIAIAFGLLTLLALIVPIPALANLITGWAGLLVAVALLLGIFNLLAVHFNRFFRQRNLYSGVLVLSMAVVFILAAADAFTAVDNGVSTIFNWVQAPLEAALASLLAFFLLGAGFQLLKHRRTGWSILFLLSAVLMLASTALVTSGLVPAALRNILQQVQLWLADVVVTAGMRGLLIGIALGTITLSIRLLIGVERPYHK